MTPRLPPGPLGEVHTGVLRTTMTDTVTRRIDKQVAIKEIDHDNRTVSGAVLVPWEVDRQRDWLRPDGVAAMFNPDPDDGVMHAGFPAEAATTEHRILEEPETLGGEEFPAGTWVADRTYHDDELWGLVEDGILQGFSIGGEVTRQVEQAADELPEEVSFPDGVDVGGATEIKNGAVEEVSDVDIPAVPRAMFTAAKALGTEKNLFESAGGREEFVETMVQRGHSEEDAGRLFDFLADVEKLGPAEAVAKFNTQTQTHEMTQQNTSGGQPDDATKWRQFKAWLTGSGGGGDSVPEPTGAGFEKAATVTADVLKEGRPLNSDNRERLMAAHDAIEAALASDMDAETYQTNRFTDDSRFDFDISAYEEEKGDDYDDKSKAQRATEKLTEEQATLVMEAVEEFERSQGEAPFTDFREWAWQKWDDWDTDKSFAVDTALDEFRTWTREMHDEQPVTGEFVDWLGDEANTDINMTDDNPDAEKVEALEKRIDELEEELAEKHDGGDGGSGGGENAEKDERIKELEERVEKLSAESAATDQLGGGDAAVSAEKTAIEAEREVFTR